MTDTCLTCESARIPSDGRTPDEIDIVSTTTALQDRVVAGRMREVAGDVPLADVVDLFASEMKYTIVSFLECLDCGRLLEWALCVRGAPVFRHVDASVLDAKRWDEVPDRFAWVGTAAFAALDAGVSPPVVEPAATDRDAAGRGDVPSPVMRVVSGRTGGHFLLKRGVDLFFAADDNSLVFRLDAAEKAGYQQRGEAFLDELAMRIRDVALSRTRGGFDARNLYRGPRGPRYRAQVSGAIRLWKISRPRPGACEVCSYSWVTHVGRAATLGESEEFMAEVRRCRNCGAYWEVGAFSHPVVITCAQALRRLPDLLSREAALGIDFPEPPPPS